MLSHVHKNTGDIPAGNGGVLLYHWPVGIIPRVLFKSEEEFQLYTSSMVMSLWLTILTSHFK